MCIYQSIRIVYRKSTPSEVNFVYMEKPQSKEGARFAELTKGRGVKTRIKTELDITLGRINNWKTRGVPPRFAQAVAGVIGCTAEEISDTMPAETPKQAANRREIDRLSPQQRQVLLSVRDLDDDDMVKVIEIIGWIKAGLKVMPAQKIEGAKEGPNPKKLSPAGPNAQGMELA